MRKKLISVVLGCLVLNAFATIGPGPIPSGTIDVSHLKSWYVDKATTETNFYNDTANTVELTIHETAQVNWNMPKKFGGGVVYVPSGRVALKGPQPHDNVDDFSSGRSLTVELKPTQSLYITLHTDIDSGVASGGEDSYVLKA